MPVSHLFDIDLYQSVFSDPHAVTDRILNERLDSERRQLEIIVLNIISHLDRRKSYHLDLRIHSGMFKLLGKWNEIRLVERVYILPEIHSEFFKCIRCLVRICKTE